MKNNILENIKTALKAFEKDSSSATKNLFQILNYPTDTNIDKIFQNFSAFEIFLKENAIYDCNQDKLLCQYWQKATIPFRISDNELQKKIALFQKNETPLIDAYLWFVVELNPNQHYSRTQLAAFTREINHIFKNGVMPVFKIENKITLAIIDRRKNKQDETKKVLEKVTLIKDIDIQNPKRSHLEIIADLEFDKLKEKKEIKNFIDIHYAWQEILSIATLNKKFYKEIANWFFWAVDKSKFPIVEQDKNQEQTNQMAIIRLLTRLIFVWFIKEKNLINENLFDENFIKNTLKDFGNDNYYKAILQNLFFATLNRPQTEREFAEDKSFFENRNNNDLNTLYRYEKLFKNENPQNIMQIFEQIPFLNGGLFDCLDKKDTKQYFDGFTRNTKHQANVPDFLFFDDENDDFSDKLKSIYEIKDKKTTLQVKGIIKILKKYKFTIEENTPLEEDIALDPELLGQVFENLLAYYNPETASTARKGTGSFYTPREIVDYMVEESLLTYLKNDFPNIKNINELPAENIKDVIKSLAHIKILDPACGSGAFPMGVLHKIVSILQNVDKDNSIWREIQKQKLQIELDKAYNITEKQERLEKINELDDIFENNLSDYGRKLFIIQNCIFGIDIQNIAIQISKLRFFLSLVIEQKNENIRPLPNLETKFVTANTLIGLEKPTGQAQIKNLKIEDLENQLSEIRQQYFNIRSKNQKNKLIQKDKEIRNQIAELLQKDGWGKSTAKKISDFDLFDQNSMADWFDAEWMFGVKDGFDLVIGNPPYVQIQKLKDKQTEFEKQKFETYSKSSDLYCLFYEKGNQLLKENGLLCMITSNKWMRAKYGETMRKFFVENTNPLLLVDFGNLQVFETATVDTNILITQKTKKTNQTKAVKFDKNYHKTQGLQKYINENAYILTALNENAWVIGEKDGFDVKSKVEKQGILIKDWNLKISYGVKTGLNEAFIIDEKTKNELIAQDEKSKEIIKPILRGRDISKWYPDFENTWLIGTFPSLKLNIEDYPIILKYLLDFGKDKLIQDGTGRKKTGNQWFETQDQIAYYKDFEKPKIIYPNMTKYMPFVYDEEGFYTNQKCFIITGKHLKYLTCFFNSALFKYCFSDNFPELGNGRELSKVYFDKIPVKPIDAEYENLFNHLVDYLVFLKKRIQHSKAIGKNYDKELLMQMLFDEISDGLIMEMYLSDEFEKYNVHLKKRLLDMPNIDLKDEEKSFEKLLGYYEIISHYTHQIQGSLSVIVTIPVIRLIYHTVRS